MLCRHFLALTFAAAVAFGGTAKIAKDVDTKTAAEANVIVRFKVPPAAKHHQHVIALGGLLKNVPGLLNTAAYSIPGTMVPLLAADPDVDFVAKDHVLKASAAPPWIGAQPDNGWHAIGADLATSVFGFTGAGVGVAVIDSGMDNLDDLKDPTGKNRIVYQQSFVPGDTSPADKYGHGNHVAGILGGTGKDSTGSKFSYTVRGVAPGVNFINLRVLDAQGQGSDSAVIAAIARAIQLQSTYNIRVMNLSLGRPVGDYCANDLLCQAVQKAWQSGIAVVVAAGNDGRDNTYGTNGYATVNVPGNNPYVITVGAMNTEGTQTKTDDVIATYSSKGPTLLDHTAKPDIVAPGNRILGSR